MKKVLEFLKKYKTWLLIGVIVIMGIIISAQHTAISKRNDEISRQENNRIALTEEITNYKDELGRVNAEKHAYQLTQQELRDSIGLLKKRNREYISYINANMHVRDTVTIETVIIKEVNTQVEGGLIKFNKFDKFGKSNRSLFGEIPYNVNDNKLSTGNVKFTLEQDIFVEGWLERNMKTNETYIHLRSDYPNLTFNSGLGIVAEPSKQFERDMRKNCGIGIAVGPNFSFSYDFINQRFAPTVGLGVTVGFTYTPKFLQW